MEAVLTLRPGHSISIVGGRRGLISGTLPPWPLFCELSPPPIWIGQSPGEPSYRALKAWFEPLTLRSTREGTGHRSA